MSKLKILMITLRADYGGGPEHLYRLITHLSEEIEVYIAAPEDRPYYEKFRSFLNMEKIITIPHRKFRISSLFQVISFLRRNKIDIVHSHGKGAGIYSRVISLLTSIPVVHTFHGIHVAVIPGFKDKFYIWLERFLTKFTLKIIAVSEGEFDKAVLMKIASAPKMQIIKNGVIIPDNRVDIAILPNTPYNILTITRFDRAKNTELLLPIMDALSASGDINNFRFIILGEGTGREAFRKMVEEKGYKDHVIFAGTTDNTSGYYLKSFCYISTSVWEGLPLSVMEAMSFGLPVVATDVRGNRDLIDHGLTGYLYPLNTPERAAKILAELSRNKELWQKVSELSGNKIKYSFSAKQMAEETLKLYLSINR